MDAATGNRCEHCRLPQEFSGLRFQNCVGSAGGDERDRP